MHFELCNEKLFITRAKFNQITISISLVVLMTFADLISGPRIGNLLDKLKEMSAIIMMIECIVFRIESHEK